MKKRLVFKKNINQRRILLFFIILSIAFIYLVFTKRALIFREYNTDYWKDRYEHSQYSLPLSARKIGDDGLHAYAGYRQMQGDNPFTVNNDKPPAGKYLLGFSTVFFKNPLIITLAIGILVVVLFYYVASRFVHSKEILLFITIFFALDSLISGQFYISGLDLAQLFFYLLSFSMIFWIKEKHSNLKKLSIALLSGIALGIFAEIKPPILLPIALFINSLLIIKRGILTLAFSIVGLIVGIFIPYIPYILMGNSVVDVIRVHKFITSIYLASSLEGIFFAPWLTMLIGKVPYVVDGSLLSISEWSLIWTILLLCYIFYAFYVLLKKQFTRHNIVLIFWVGGVLVMYSFVPFYVRYLVIIFPFLFIILGILLNMISKRYKYLFILILFILTLFKYISFLQPQIDPTIENLKHTYSHQYYKDIYEELLNTDSRPNMSREEFDYTIRKFLYDTDIVHSQVQEKSRKVTNNKVEINVEITHFNRILGPFVEKKKIVFVKEKGEWRMIWDWDLVVKDYKPGISVKKEYLLASRGTIFDEKENPIAWDDVNGLLLWISPSKIDYLNENTMLSTLSEYFSLSGVGMQNTYLENPLKNEYLLVGSPLRPIIQKDINKISAFPGVLITQGQNRYYGKDTSGVLENKYFDECCTRLYSPSLYSGATLLEKKYDKDLDAQNGGWVRIYGETMKRDLISRDLREGRNVIINNE